MKEQRTAPPSRLLLPGEPHSLHNQTRSYGLPDACVPASQPEKFVCCCCCSLSARDSGGSRLDISATMDESSSSDSECRSSGLLPPEPVKAPSPSYTRLLLIINHPRKSPSHLAAVGQLGRHLKNLHPLCRRSIESRAWLRAIASARPYINSTSAITPQRRGCTLRPSSRIRQ